MGMRLSTSNAELNIRCQGHGAHDKTVPSHPSYKSSQKKNIIVNTTTVKVCKRKIGHIFIHIKT